ncbi:recombination protein RecR [candidate division KSB1 bacterium]|nr:recombination protein RecR [candidate division KSB1 bacterium]
MKYASETVEKAIHELSKLPGIGRKTAQRHVFFLLKQPEEYIRRLTESLVELKSKVIHCSICFNITETDPCRTCADERRDRSTICVVEEASDVLALERTGEFKGLYHVLGGALSPLDGIGPEDLRVKELLMRLSGVKEIIIATNPNTEGEATALYIAKLVKPLDIKVSRIARGIPVGADLEYADEMTLARAIQGRLDY